MQVIPRPRPLTASLVVLAVLAGVGFRLYTRSDLWLDEALTVNISRLPVADLLRQLRHDGHPPLFYLLLHVWMKAFGEGDIAVRSLSALFGLATLPVFWLAGRRYGGSRCAIAALVLLATSPFAVLYSTETRMYSLVTLLVVAGWLAVRRALDRPAPAPLLAVAVVSGLLALTHYWAFYLLAATGLLLLWLWRTGRPEALRVACAMMAGGVLFLPWLPSFLAQAGHTGTPWGRPDRPLNVMSIMFTDWGGGPNGEAQLLSVLVMLLMLLALFGRAVDRRRIELDLATRPPVRAEIFVAGGTLAVAILAGYASAAAYASRYTSAIFPLVLLAAAFGVTLLLHDRVRVGLLGVMALLGLMGCVRVEHGQRTEGHKIASYITNHGGAPGDVIAFCPDQLGPSTMRHIPPGYVGLTFPNGDDPHLVDWADYGKRQRTGKPRDFARMLDHRAGPHTVWLVWATGYRTLGHKCETAVDALKKLRPGGTPVVASGNQYEHAWLYQYGPVPGR